jgi:hypothetical protein
VAFRILGEWLPSHEWNKRIFGVGFYLAHPTAIACLARIARLFGSSVAHADNPLNFGPSHSGDEGVYFANNLHVALGAGR